MKCFMFSICFLVLGSLLASCQVEKEDLVDGPLTPYEHGLTSTDIEFLGGFSLSALPALPRSESNRYADALNAANLGRKLFFDRRFSSNDEVSCASCHQPMRYFSDGRVRGEGVGVTRRNTPSLLGVSFGPWAYWDGRKDSLWAQALEPLEKDNEHNISQEKVAKLVEQFYAQEYSAVFNHEQGPANQVELNDDKRTTEVFVNVGKALMAYQRRLVLQPAKFDRFIDGLGSGKPMPAENRFTQDELAGMRLFMGKASCASCHNGPLFTNFEFHNIGAPEADTRQVDLGRHSAIERLRNDEFNCLSVWSDAEDFECEELTYLKTQGPELVGAFKTPSLRNVSATAPYMHAGQLHTLMDVVEHYNSPKPPFYDREQHPNRPHFDVLPLGLSEDEKRQLLSFLATLESPISGSDTWWQAP